jgi:hypothetical protein
VILTVGRERKQYTPEEAIKRGQAVQRLLADDTFRQIVMEETADECMSEWAVGKTQEAREAAFTKLQGLRAIEAKLQAILDQAMITADSRRKYERRAKEI